MVLAVLVNKSLVAYVAEILVTSEVRVNTALSSETVVAYVLSMVNMSSFILVYSGLTPVI